MSRGGRGGEGGGFGGVVGREVDVGDARLVEDVCAGRAGVLEHEVVSLGADDVPRVVVWPAGCDEVRVCPRQTKSHQKKRKGE